MKKVVSPFFCNLFLLFSKRILFVFIIYCTFASFSVLAKMNSSSYVFQKDVVLECVCRNDTVELDPYTPQVDMLFSVMEMKGRDVEDATKKAQRLCSVFGGNDLDCINVSVKLECSCSTDMGNGELYSERLIGFGAGGTEALRDVRISCDEVLGEEATVSQCIDLTNEERKLL